MRGGGRRRALHEALLVGPLLDRRARFGLRHALRSAPGVLAEEQQVAPHRLGVGGIPFFGLEPVRPQLD